METFDERRSSTIERIAGNLERFDDDTLQELERLTDPANRAIRPPEPRGVTRRQVIVGFAAGAGTMGAAALGLARLGASDDASAAELDRLREREALASRLEAVALDETVGEGLNAVGTSLAETDLAASRLLRAVEELGPMAVAAIQLVDPALADRVRDELLSGATELVAQVSGTIDTWSTELEQPTMDRLRQRADLRAAEGR